MLPYSVIESIEKEGDDKRKKENKMKNENLGKVEQGSNFFLPLYFLNENHSGHRSLSQQSLGKVQECTRNRLPVWTNTHTV